MALDKDRGCLLGDGAGKTAPEAPGPLMLKVDMKEGKAMLRQVRLNLGGMCLGSTWKMKLLPLWHEKSATRQVVLGAVGVADLGKCGTSGKWIRRKLMKVCTLPNHYEAGVPLLKKEPMEEEYHVFLFYCRMNCWLTWSRDTQTCWWLGVRNQQAS